MNAFIISNKNDALAATSDAGCESCDNKAFMLCGHMMRLLLLILQCASRGIEQAWLQVM